MEETTDLRQHKLQTEQPAEEAGIALTDILVLMRARWRWYIASLAACVFLAVVYLFWAMPMYTRTTEVLLKDDATQSISGDFSNLLGMSAVSPEILDEMFIMTSPEIMGQVISNLQLNQIYSTRIGLRKKVLYHTSPVTVEFDDSLSAPKYGVSFKIRINEDRTGVTLSKFRLKGKKVKGDDVTMAFGETVNTPVGRLAIYPTKFIDESAYVDVEEPEVPTKLTYSYTPLKIAARNYCKKLQSEFLEDRGTVISLSVACPSAQMASDLLEGLVDAYNQRWISDRSQIAMATSRFIDDRLVTIEDELGDVEESITDYKSEHRMLDMDAVAQIYLAQSAENQNALNQLAQEIAIGRYIKSELMQGDLTRMLPATAEIGGTDIQSMVTTYNQLVAERNLKLETLPEESTLIRQKTQALESTREAIIASVDAALESLNKRYDAISLIDTQTQSQLASAPGQARYLMSEERKQKVKESLYLFLLQRREENELSQAFAAFNTRMVVEPFGVDEPTSPNTKMVLLIALVAGVLIPTLIIYEQEVMNTKVRSRKDIEDLDIPFLGEVPLAETRKCCFKCLARKKDKVQTVRPILVRPHAMDVINEAFRMVRTNIDFMGAMTNMPKDKGRVFMVVSLNVGSGKTFISQNSAAMFAVKGKKVCLVDFDLRKGTASKCVGSPRHGIVDFLIGKTDNVDELIVRNVEGIENFDVLPEGIIPPNPTELLYSDNLERLVNQLRERYDYIFFDAPPLGLIADSRLLNPFVDMTIFVMRSGMFDKRDLSELCAIYAEKRYNNLALVLNGTDDVHGTYGAYGTYGYHSRQRD